MNNFYDRTLDILLEIDLKQGNARPGVFGAGVLPNAPRQKKKVRGAKKKTETLASVLKRKNLAPLDVYQFNPGRKGARFQRETNARNRARVKAIIQRRLSGNYDEEKD